MPGVVAVVVTWNRRALLEESLAAVLAQTHAPERVIVVDNASTDGTSEWLDDEWGDDPRVQVEHLSENTGGAGGFARGIELALGASPDLIWLLDDDTIPTPSAVAELVRAWQGYPSRRPAALASRVIWTDGRDHPMNTPRRKPGATDAEIAAAAEVGAVPIRSASFVSLMCDAEVVAERGVPIGAYFLWNDDFEYSTRLIKGGVGLYCPDSVVVHKTRVFGDSEADPGERFFYEVRNKLWLFGRSRSLSPREKALYGGSTLLRWRRTYTNSEDKATLRRATWRGIRAGLRRPDSNAEVLEPALPSHRLPEGTPFSLLMSTWAGDDPAQLRLAYESATAAQTRPPAEAILVQDGPVGAELTATIADLPDVRVVALPENRGLGPALNAGLAAASHDVIARMDTDDICLPHRFEVQLPLIEAGADIVGAGLLEFGADIDDIVGTRTPPVDPDEIRRVIGFRDPFNHPTVVYRRSAVLAAGGYGDLPLLEDYLLFTRMVKQGAVPANVAEPLVAYRVGAGAYARRGGKDLLRSELTLQRRLRELGHTSRREWLRNVVVRGGYRLVPEGVRKVAYRRLLANRSDALRG